MTSRAALLTVVGDHVPWCERRVGPAPEKIQAASRVQTPAARPQPIEEPQPGEAEGGDAGCRPQPSQAPEQVLQSNAVATPPTSPDFNSSNLRNGQ